MKLYQYDELKKLNQALGSFKRNGIPVKSVQILTVENKVVFFVMTDPILRESDSEKPKKVEQKVEAKAKKIKEPKKESKEENKSKTE